MKKVLILFMVTFCLAATAHDDIATQLAEKVWGVNAETVIEYAPNNKAQTTMTVDVACNAFTVAATSPEPTLGTSFIIGGYIYPAGTLEEHGLNSGINDDGSAEFPDLVIGTWICRGNVYAPQVYSSTIFTFNDGNTIVTGGNEANAGGMTFYRAITGGTGDYAFVRGQQGQDIVGINATAQPNFVFTFQTAPNFNFKK